jgi:baseplate J-like protein
VPVGQQINVGDKVYLAAESAVIGTLGSTEIAVIATVAGSAQNQTAETAATLQSVPAGIDSSAVLLTMVGGTDAESDESLLARYEERLRRPAAGGNQYDFRNWCLEVPGVVDAFIYPLRRGNGFVDAVILGENGIPSAETLAAVQAHVDAVRPVTRKNGFLALAPSIQTVNVAVTITLSSGTDTDTATAAIKSAVNAYFDALKPGDTLIKSQLETLISEVYGVRDRVLTTPVSNIKPQESAEDIYWLRAGSISVEYTT